MLVMFKGKGCDRCPLIVKGAVYKCHMDGYDEEGDGHVLDIKLIMGIHYHSGEPSRPKSCPFSWPGGVTLQIEAYE